MKISIKNGKIETGSLFRLFIVGYTVGVSSVFLPFAPLILLTTIAGDSGDIWQGLLAIPMIPLIAFFQSLILSAITVLGLYAYNRIKGIEVISK